MVRESIRSGKALESLIAMVEAQGGDSSVIHDTEKFARASHSCEVKAEKTGYITRMDTESCGIASSMLGAGRERSDSVIDFAAGIILKKKVGDYVQEGDTVAIMYASREEFFGAAGKRYQGALTIEPEKAPETPLIYARVTRDGVEYV